MNQRPALVGIEPRDGEVVLRVDLPGQQEIFVPLGIEEASERAIELAVAAIKAATPQEIRRRPVLRVVRGGRESR